MNWHVDSTFPFRSLIRLTSLRTTMPSAPRLKPTRAGHTTSNCLPYTASTSAVVADPAMRPAFSAFQLSSSLSLIRS